METAEHLYHQKIMEYEDHLKQFIQENYALKISFLTLMNWGYTTTAYYMNTDKGKFVCRISKLSDEKRFGLEKDIKVTYILKDDFNIPTYLASNSGQFLLDYVDKLDQPHLLRLSDHIDGVNAFDISIENLKEMAEFLQKLHFGISEDKLTALRGIFTTNDGTFLHGDLTPTNCLVSYAKLVRVVDFEHSFFGPIEYDLARTAVFSWFHLNSYSLSEIAETIGAAYGHKFNVQKLHQYIEENLNSHLENIIKHKNDYSKDEDYIRDIEFTKNMINKVRI